MCRTFSRKPVLSLCAVPRQRLLLCLSDAMVTVHEIEQVNYPLLATLLKTKGATMFVINSQVTCSCTLVDRANLQQLAHWDRYSDGLRICASSAILEDRAVAA